MKKELESPYDKWKYLAFQSFDFERTWWTCSGEASRALIYLSTIVFM
jgi:hypothetical protein